MRVVRTAAEARSALADLPRPLGFVPTMGALHAGHLALVEAAAATCAATVASIFVNPRQFGAGEDLGTYPRDEAGDLRALEEAGVELVFAPSPEELYPPGFCTEVRVTGVTDCFEGAERPVHFGGVALVVAKLLNIVRPDAAFFGQKDAQQLAVVRRLVRDLDLPVRIVGVPTVREPDGLALSSRNAYLAADQRAVAPVLHGALLDGAAAAAVPGAGPGDVVAAAARTLAAAGQTAGDAVKISVDYLAVVDADDFSRVEALDERSLLIAAVRLGATRLLDNVFLSPQRVPHGGRDT